MKKYLLGVVMVLGLSLMSKAQSNGTIKDLDLKNGFKSIILGDSISKYKDLSLIGDGDSGVTFYDANSVGLEVGDIKLKSINISAFQGRVSKIIIFFDPQDGFKIRQVLESAYGLYTDRPNRFMEKYEWDGEKIDLTLNYDNKSKNGSIMFSSKELFKQERQLREDKSKKAVNDL